MENSTTDESFTSLENSASDEKSTTSAESSAANEKSTTAEDTYIPSVQELAMTSDMSDGKIKVKINEEAIEKAKNLAGYNLIATSDLSMTSKEIYDTYHNLWRIEESFRAMKSQLDARPVYLQK